MSLATLSISEYARRLASADPTPGGGSASALVGALGASLVSMVAQLTGASPKFATIAERMRIVAGEGQRLCASFIAAIDEDVAAFDRVSAAYKLPKASD
ncbi:MAG TPA: cyclodeaminase/cyclohydrolase family protein, partial [Vicinamibacterales bacterium]